MSQTRAERVSERVNELFLNGTSTRIFGHFPPYIVVGNN